MSCSDNAWAGEASVFVQPVVAAEDKENLTEFFADMASDPQHLTSASWEHIDRQDSCTKSNHGAASAN